MFTGIVESLATVVKIEKELGNLHLYLNAAFIPELKIDQSVAHNGVCLTVVDIHSDYYKVTAVSETLSLTNLEDLIVGDIVNVERCMQMNARLDGHIVQGHVDAMGTCILKEENEGSWRFVFSYEASREHLIVEKGSICINGISLTAFNVSNTSFEVAIIPYTYEHTNLKQVEINSKVNLEFDIIGKYIARLQDVK
ncbi:MAG: riboflavin synthase [Chitinophagales bacterium]|nr:riboflavin synthase [Bacteroidota bacterium]MCB9256802.1 riboflavin synthase [Chitinophagales bacterium]